MWPVAWSGFGGGGNGCAGWEVGCASGFVVTWLLVGIFEVDWSGLAGILKASGVR